MKLSDDEIALLLLCVREFQLSQPPEDWDDWDDELNVMYRRLESLLKRRMKACNSITKPATDE